MKRACLVFGLFAAPLVFAAVTEAGAWEPRSFLDQLRSAPAVSVSTVPTTGTQAGDVNPYGVVVVPTSTGVLKRGDILVANFNDSNNDQGTGSTIVRVDPASGNQTVFFDAGTLVGLNTALVALRSGFIVVGATPRVDATPPTVANGELIFLDGNGNVVLTLTDSQLLGGPWDATVDDRDPDEPRLFVSNVLSGTIVRIQLRVHPKRVPAVSVESITKIGSGFAARTDPAALVIGPTGLALDEDGRRLFVADTGNNRIAVLDARAGRDQGAGATLFAGAPLAGPLGLVHVPFFDHIVVVNGDAIPTTPATPPNLAIEIDERGTVVATRQLDTSGTPGGLFGVTVTRFGGELSLVFVDDNSNSVNVQQTR